MSSTADLGFPCDTAQLPSRTLPQLHESRPGESDELEVGLGHHIVKRSWGSSRILSVASTTDLENVVMEEQSL